MDQNTNTNTVGNLSNTPKVETLQPNSNIVKESVSASIQGQTPTKTEPVDMTIKGNPNKPLTLISFVTSIRRKQSSEMKGLPGEEYDARNYRVGSSLDRQTGKTLKGINGNLEKLLMPQIVATSDNAYEFMSRVDTYWSNIGVPIPADDVNKEEVEQGKVLDIKFKVAYTVLKDRFFSQPSITTKIAYLCNILERGEAELEYQSIGDFLLLTYCLKYSRVANDIKDVNKSGNIYFYLYEKSSAIATKLTALEKKNKANQLFASIQNDEAKLNSALLALKQDYTLYKTLEEKVLKVDEVYNVNDTTRDTFILTVEDKNWKTKYLILTAVNTGRLRNLPNTTIYYYNDKMIGNSLDETVHFLNSPDADNVQILATLEREIGFSIK